MGVFREISNWVLGSYKVRTTQIPSDGAELQHVRLDIGTGTGEQTVSSTNPLPVDFSSFPNPANVNVKQWGDAPVDLVTDDFSTQHGAIVVQGMNTSNFNQPLQIRNDRLMVEIGESGNIALTKSSDPISSDGGLVVRNIPSGNQNISYAAPTVTTGNITGLGQTISVTLNGDNCVVFSISGTYGGVSIIFEGSLDGATWFTVQAARLDSNTIETASGSITNTARAWEASVNGLLNFRVRSTAWTSGTAAIRINASYSATEPVPAIAPHAVTLASTTLTAVTPGTAATNLGKAIDSVVGATDTNVGALMQRVDTPGILTPAVNDYVLPRTNNRGMQWAHLGDANGNASVITTDAPPDKAAALVVQQAAPFTQANGTLSVAGATAEFNGYDRILIDISGTHSNAVIWFEVRSPANPAGWQLQAWFTGIETGGPINFISGTNLSRRIWTIVNLNNCDFRLRLGSITSGSVTYAFRGFKGTANQQQVYIANQLLAISGTVETVPSQAYQFISESGVLAFGSITALPTTVLLPSGNIFSYTVVNTTNVELNYSLDNGVTNLAIGPNQVHNEMPIKASSYYPGGSDITVNHFGTAPTSGRFSVKVSYW